jgi:mRNA interferase RelE/StbE
MVDIEYSSRAVEWIEKADPDAREQVRKKIEQAADFPDHFLDRLTDSPFYKLRAGDYRCIVDWRRNGDEPDVLFIREIGHRDGFYD